MRIPAVPDAMRLWVTVATIALASCARAPQGSRIERLEIAQVASASGAALSESALAALVVCHDTLGRPEAPQRRAAVTRCTPCIPYELSASPDRARAHANRVWLQGARAPYDSLDIGADCARRAFDIARANDPASDSLAVEIALFQLADARESVRRVALHDLDSRLSRHIAGAQPTAALALLTQLAFGIWSRAQRQFERPHEIEYTRVERRAHDLAEQAPVFAALPPIPPTSDALGVSEAEWSARLFTAAAHLTVRPAERSQLLRLALAPWVLIGDWQGLDSAARAMDRVTPGDSAALPALALAAYRRMQRPVTESPQVMTLFDSALRAMPRADSARFDSFDGVLARGDDEWRYGFLPSARDTLDARGWAVIDPLWSTPVNEVRLARRARTAEADYRYADIAPNGASGSSTAAGELLKRLGPPVDRWELTARRFGGQQMIERRWRSIGAVSEFEPGPDTWRMFYGPWFSAERTPRFLPNSAPECVVGPSASLHACVLNRRADWTGLPFYANTDTVDVSIARFRASGDSADIYISARLPLRGFKSRSDRDANARNRIVASAWLTSATGQTAFRADSAIPLPGPEVIASYFQWQSRVGSNSMMHRVEGLELTRPSGARGAAQFTSDAHVAFALHGFGMSDVLVASTARSRVTIPQRWSHYAVTPNGGVVAPREPLALVWEIYDLTPDPAGRIRWRVTIQRERGQVVSRDNMQDMLVGSRRAGTKVLANEAQASNATWTRSEAVRPAVVEHLNFNLGDAPVGRHVVQVTVEDLVSGKSVSRSVSVRVLPPALQRRGLARFSR